MSNKKTMFFGHPKRGARRVRCGTLEVATGKGDVRVVPLFIYTSKVMAPGVAADLRARGLR